MARLTIADIDFDCGSMSEGELLAMADQALASLNARFDDRDEIRDMVPDQSPRDVRDALTEACDTWDRFADYFREP